MLRRMYDEPFNADAILSSILTNLSSTYDNVHTREQNRRILSAKLEIDRCQMHSCCLCYLMKLVEVCAMSIVQTLCTLRPTTSDPMKVICLI